MIDENDAGFLIELMNAVNECSKTGTPYRLTLGIGDRDAVTIDVYKEGTTMAKMNALVAKAMNESLPEEA